MYQVLARRWRPRSLDEVAGQEHVVAVLRHGLDTGQIHHAYLFAGLYGVGKTTLGRILAKCLNCETSITATPCNQCASCRAAEEGSFPDLIEVDAASKTKVEETRAMLDGMGYRPVMGRFRVYLIDEVHMLSGHSFNALLKTLEEPPEHVRFILATTELDKVPLTVASRCLTLRLRRLQAAELAVHLRTVLGKDNTPYEDEAVAMLAQQAMGSVREVLSLTEQALAAGQGALRLDAVRTMLGLLDRQGALHLLEAVIAKDSGMLQKTLAGLLEQGVDEAGILDGTIRLLTELAWAKALPREPEKTKTGQAACAQEPDQGLPGQLLDALTPEEVHVFLEFATRGKRDLPVLPDRWGTLAVVFLRMMAFGRKLAASAQKNGDSRARAESGLAAPSPQPATPSPERHASMAVPVRPAAPAQRVDRPQHPPEPCLEPRPAIPGTARHEPDGSTIRNPQPDLPADQGTVQDGSCDASHFWEALLQKLGLGARVLAIARKCHLLDQQGSHWTVGVPQGISRLLDADTKSALADAVRQVHHGVVLHFQVINTPAGEDHVTSFIKHPCVQAISKDQLLGGGQVALDSIRPRNKQEPC